MILVKVTNAEEVREVSAELRRLVAETQLGVLLFGQMLAQLAESSFLDDVDRLIGEHLDCNELDQQTIDDCLAAILVESEKWQLDKRCVGKRNIEIVYRKLLLQVAVSCAHQIALFKIKAHVQQRSVAKNNFVDCGSRMPSCPSSSPRNARSTIA